MSRDPAKGNFKLAFCTLQFAIVLSVPLTVLTPLHTAAQNDKGPPRIRNVYVPHDELDGLFGEGKKGVLMTRDEFDELWTKAHAAGRADAVPPEPAVLTSAHYEAELGETELRIIGRVRASKLIAGWQAVPLAMGGLAIESAEVDGKQAWFGRNPNGELTWVLREKGDYELVVRLSAPLVRTAGDLTTMFRLPPVPASEFLLTVPEGKQARVGGVELKPQANAKDRTVRVPVDRTGQVPLAILDQAGGGKRTSLVFVRSDVNAAVEPAGVRLDAAIELDVAAHATDEFRVVLPARVDVAAVESTELAGWTAAEPQEDRVELTLKFRQPFEGKRVVRLRGLVPMQLGQPFSMPELVVPGAVSQIGEITLQPAATVRLSFDQLGGVRRLPAAAPGTAAPPAASGLRHRFAFWQDRYQLTFVAAARDQEVSAAVASLVEIGHAGLVLRGSVTIEPRYAPLFQVALELPRHWNVTSLQAAGQPVVWETAAAVAAAEAADSAAAKQVIRFDLPQPLAPGASLALTITAESHPAAWLDDETRYSQAAVPELRVVGASEVEGTVVIEAPAEIELRTSDVSPDLQPIAPPTAPGQARVGTALAYRYQDAARVAGRLDARLKPAQISVETLAFAALARESLGVYYQADMQLVGGTARTFDFTLPAAVGEKIEIVPMGAAVRVVEKQHTTVAANDSDTGEELLLWHIVLDQPVTGRLMLVLRAELKAESESEVSDQRRLGAAPSLQNAADFALPMLRFRNVTRQSGYIAVEAAADQEVKYTTDGLREVDSADLPPIVAYRPAGRIVAAYQYQRLPYRLTLAGDRRDPEEVLAAVCDSATITSIVGREGLVRHRAAYTLRSLGVQHLAVQLPAAANLWSVTLDGEPIEVRRTGGKHIVPLPAGVASGATPTHTVELIYETGVAAAESAKLQSSEPNDAGGSQTRSPARRDSEQSQPLGTSNQQSAFSGQRSFTRALTQTIRQTAPVLNMSTLQLKWTVHLPDGAVLVASDGDFQPEVEPTRPSLVGRIRETIAEHSTSDLRGKLAGLVWAVAGAVVVWMLVQSRSWVIRIGVVGTGLVAIVGLTLMQVTRSAKEASVASYANRFDSVTKSMPTAAAPAAPAGGGAMGGGMAMGGSGMAGMGIREPAGMRGAMMPPAASEPVPAGEVMDLAKSEKNGRDSDVAQDAPAPKAAPERPMPGADRSEAASDLAAANSSIDAKKRLDESTKQVTEYQQSASTRTDRESTRTDREISEFSVATTDMRNKVTRIGRAPGVVDEEDFDASKPIATLSPAKVMRGRLSLTMNLDTQGRRGVVFARQAGEGDLVIRIQEATATRSLMWALAAAVALVAWLIRERSGAGRFVWAATWLLAPVGLSALVPLAWTPVLDGVFVGGVAAAALWFATDLAGWLKARLASWGVVTAVGVVLVALAQPAAAQPAAQYSVLGTQYLVLGTQYAEASTQSAVGNQQSAISNPQSPFTLFVPYDPKNGDPRGSRFVYLPHDEFLKLWNRANPEKPIEPPADLPAIVARAEYDGRLDGELARFAGRLVIYTFRDQWTRVPLPLGKVALERVEINGQAASVDEKVPGVERRADGNVDAAKTTAPSPPPAATPAPAAPKPEPASLGIYIEKAGTHVVDLRFHVPVTRLGATGRMTLPLRPTAAGVLRFELPESDLIVETEGSPGGWRRTKVEDRELIELPAGDAREVTVRWQPRREQAPATNLVTADQAVLVDIQDSGIHLRSKFMYRVAQGSVRELRLRVPTGVAVRSVRGPDVADWSVEDDQAVVALKADNATGTEVSVDAFLIGQEPLGHVPVRTLEPLGAARETGRIVVGCSGQFRVRIDRSGGLGQIEREGVVVPPSTEALCEMISAFRYTGRPWTLELGVERLRPQLAAFGRTALAVASQRITVHAEIDAVIEDELLASFDVRLPGMLRVSRVSVPAEGDWFLRRDGDDQVLAVDFGKPTIGKVTVAIDGTLSRDAADPLFVAPLATVAGAQTQKGEIAIFLDDDLDAVLAESGGAQSVDPSRLSDSLRQVGKVTPNYAFRFDAAPQGLELRLRPAKSELSADVATTVSVREGSLAVLSQIDFEVRRAGRSEFRFTTPDWLGGDVEVRGPSIRQISSAAGPEGRRTWTVTVQQAVRGGLRLHLVQLLPLPDDGKIAAPVIEPLDVERSRSYVILENRTADEMREASSTGVASLPLADVPVEVADELRKRAVSAHRVTAAGEASLVWQKFQRERESGLAASVNLADVVTVVHDDGSYRAKITYRIANRTLQFLELGMPRDSAVWALHVDGQPARPAVHTRGGREVTLLPLPKTSEADLASEVVLVYTGSLGGRLPWWQKTSPPTPEVLGNVPVARTLWTVYLPREFSAYLIERDSNLTAAAQSDQEIERRLSVIQELNEVFACATDFRNDARRRQAIGNLKQISAGFQNEQEAQQVGQSWAKRTLDNKAEADLSFNTRWNEVQQQSEKLNQGIRKLTADVPAAPADSQRDGVAVKEYYNEGQRRSGAQSDASVAAGDLLLDLESKSASGKGDAADERELRRYKMQTENRAQLGKLKEAQQIQQQEAEVSNQLLHAAPIGVDQGWAQSSIPGGGGQAAHGSILYRQKDDVGPVGQTMTGRAFGNDAVVWDGVPNQVRLDEVIGGATAWGTMATRRAGGRSIEFDIPLVGQAYYFSKVLGEPKLVLRVRHRDLIRYAAAAAWAALCLGLAGVVFFVATRSGASRWIGLGWPWLASLLGAAWWFLLPLGGVGLVFLLIGLSALAWRTRPRPAQG